MRRFAAAVTTVVTVLTLVSACGGSDYCDAVKNSEKTLNTFGSTRTDAGYERYAKVFGTIGDQAPKEVTADWKKLSTVSKNILKAQDDVGLKLEEMNDAQKTKKLDKEQRTKLNDAYKAFNDTAKERAAVVKNVKQECKITLK